MRSKSVALRIARQRYPDHTVVVVEPFVFVIKAVDGVILPIDDGQLLRMYSDLIFDCTEMVPKVVKDREGIADAGPKLLEFAAEYAELAGQKSAKDRKYFKDRKQRLDGEQQD